MVRISAVSSRLFSKLLDGLLYMHPIRHFSWLYSDISTHRDSVKVEDFETMWPCKAVFVKMQIRRLLLSKSQCRFNPPAEVSLVEELHR